MGYLHVDSILVLLCLKYLQVKVGMKSASSELTMNDVAGMLILALSMKMVIDFILMSKKSLSYLCRYQETSMEQGWNIGLVKVYGKTGFNEKVIIF